MEIQMNVTFTKEEIIDALHEKYKNDSRLTELFNQKGCIFAYLTEKRPDDSEKRIYLGDVTFDMPTEYIKPK